MIDGTYTRLLRSALNISWRDHVSNDILWCTSKTSSKIRERRMRLAGHCVRYKEEEASKLVLWNPSTRGRVNRGKRKTTYIDTLLKDTGFENENEIKTAMLDREGWKRRTHGVWAGARPR